MPRNQKANKSNRAKQGPASREVPSAVASPPNVPAECAEGNLDEQLPYKLDGAADCTAAQNSELASGEVQSEKELVSQLEADPTSGSSLATQSVDPQDATAQSCEVQPDAVVEPATQSVDPQDTTAPSCGEVQPEAVVEEETLEAQQHFPAPAAFEDPSQEVSPPVDDECAPQKLGAPTNCHASHTAHAESFVEAAQPSTQASEGLAVVNSELQPASIDPSIQTSSEQVISKDVLGDTSLVEESKSAQGDASLASFTGTGTPPSEAFDVAGIVQTLVDTQQAPAQTEAASLEESAHLNTEALHSEHKAKEVSMPDDSDPKSASVATAVEGCPSRTSGEASSAPGRVGSVVVLMRSKAIASVDATRDKVFGTLAGMRRAVVELPFSSKLANGVVVVKGRVSRISVLVDNGFVSARTSIGDTLVHMRARLDAIRGDTSSKIIQTYAGARAAISRARTKAVEKAKEAASLSKAAATKRPVASSAAGGAVIVGTGGAATGLVVGSVSGAVCALPLALFTFGLSIPVGAMVGGGTGAAVGATAGGAAGAVGGSAVGLGLEHRDSIKKFTMDKYCKARAYSEYVKESTFSSVVSLRSRIRNVYRKA
eukprot:TRINITY_DN1171_c0_g2_i1.p1 TRINITY_DN1171_c0_g2~~TRINITY_DN1171_c0_g2_i1.p1  ORF type:complete len:600 (-),score=108.61 TRINITY_DN1171_c0_g2_i1:336-2135(-)